MYAKLQMTTPPRPRLVLVSSQDRGEEPLPTLPDYPEVPGSDLREPEKRVGLNNGMIIIG